MARIVIAGVSKGENHYVVRIALVKTIIQEGRPVDQALGEATIPFSSDMEIKDVKDRVVDAARRIMDSHKDALDKRRDLEELEFPEIT